MPVGSSGFGRARSALVPLFPDVLEFLASVAKDSKTRVPASLDATSHFGARRVRRRAWFDTKADTSSFQAVGGGAGAGAGSAGPAPRKLVRDIAGEKLGAKDKPDVFSLRCTVSYFRNEDGRWQYPSNPENKRKVVQQGDAWVDESTGRTLDACQRRYVLSLQVADATGCAWCTAFDDTAAQLLRTSADELWALSEQDAAAAAGVWKGALFRACVLKVRAKAETYNDERRVKCSLLACEPVNFKAESRLLLEQIRRYVN